MPHTSVLFEQRTFPATSKASCCRCCYLQNCLLYMAIQPCTDTGANDIDCLLWNSLSVVIDVGQMSSRLWFLQAKNVARIRQLQDERRLGRSMFYQFLMSVMQMHG